MPLITALLHTKNDALRLGRALETLYACDDILVIDHGSRDATVRIAHEYGSRVIVASAGTSPAEYLRPAGLPATNPTWILCLDPRESLTEKLAASLFEWKSVSPDSNPSAARAFSMFVREETPEGWLEIPIPQTRLVPRDWKRWHGTFPIAESSALVLEGELLRFAFP
jgi:glycosyltransferase involved in cell wall biosynthesis